MNVEVVHRRHCMDTRDDILHPVTAFWKDIWWTIRVSGLNPYLFGLGELSVLPSKLARHHLFRSLHFDFDIREKLGVLKRLEWMQ